MTRPALLLTAIVFLSVTVHGMNSSFDQDMNLRKEWSPGPNASNLKIHVSRSSAKPKPQSVQLHVLYSHEIPEPIRTNYTPVFWEGSPNGFRKGAMGNAWLTNHRQHRECVVKTATEQEYNVCLKIKNSGAQCPNIATVFFAEKIGTQYFVVYEYAGETLDKIQNLPEREAIRILRSVSIGIQWLHDSYNFAHGDIHPGNVTVQGKLIDLGNAVPSTHPRFAVGKQLDIRRLRYLLFNLIGLKPFCYPSSNNGICLFRCDPQVALNMSAAKYPLLSKFALSGKTQKLSQSYKWKPNVPQFIKDEWAPWVAKYGLYRCDFPAGTTAQSVVTALQGLSRRRRRLTASEILTNTTYRDPPVLIRLLDEIRESESVP